MCPRHHRGQAQYCRRDCGQADCHSETRIASNSGIELYGVDSPDQGRCAYHRAGELGITKPGSDDRLRRLAHGDSRRVWLAGVWHRAPAKWSTAGHADAAASPSPRPSASRSMASCRAASQPRTSFSRLSDRSAPTAQPVYVIEYAGSAIRALSIEGRMTVCNMSIEAGARAAMVAPDEKKTFAYLKGRRFSPKGAAWDEPSPSGASCPAIRARSLIANSPLTPLNLCPLSVGARAPAWLRRSRPLCPIRRQAKSEIERKGFERASRIHGLEGRNAARRGCPSTASSSAPAPTGASKICAPRLASQPVQGGRHTSAQWSFQARRPWKAEAEREGLHRIFIEAGLDWREPGCSMCLAMTPTFCSRASAAHRPANRNFEGRQDAAGARTWFRAGDGRRLPPLQGTCVDIRKWAVREPALQGGKA